MENVGESKKKIFEFDDLLLDFVKKVKFFQDRALKKNRFKARSKRRLITGLREIEKHVNVGNIKFVIFAIDIEQGSDGKSPYEHAVRLKRICDEQNVLHVTSVGKHKLGLAVHRFPFVSAIGFLNFEGAEDLFELVVENFNLKPSVDESSNSILPIQDSS